MATHLIAILGLALLCAAWIVVQQATGNLVEERGCGGCSGCDDPSGCSRAE